MQNNNYPSGTEAIPYSNPNSGRWDRDHKLSHLLQGMKAFQKKPVNYNKLAAIDHGSQKKSHLRHRKAKGSFN